MNMISELRQRVRQSGKAEITSAEYDRLQAEWIMRTGINASIQYDATREAYVANLEQQVTLLRDALDTVVLLNPCLWSHEKAQKALAATTDLSGMILCEKKPTAWCQNVIYEMAPEFAFSWVQTQLHDFPLYRAWDQK